MDKTYLTDYTESIEEFSSSFEFIITNSNVKSKAKPEGFYSTGQGIVSKNFYIGNNLTSGLVSIDVENFDSIILSIPKDGKYDVIISKTITKNFSPKRGGIILPSDHVCYQSVTNVVDDLIIIINMKKLKSIFKKNYNYDSDKITTSFINLDIENKKVLSLVNFIKSTLETTINFPDLRASLLIKTDIEELAALYVADIIADTLNIPINKKNTSPDASLVSKAEGFMEENPALYFTIKDIADSAFTTPRNLQLAFKKHRTYSPMNFLKERKLNKARKMILKSQSGSTIKSIVLSAGILDSNRFSLHYRQLFGELPSETMRKSMIKPEN